MTPKLPLRRAFRKVRPLILSTCRTFCDRRPGVDVDLAVSDAYYYFLTRYVNFDPAKSRLQEWTWRWTYMALQTAEKARAKQEKRDKRVPMELEDVMEWEGRGREFDPAEFLLRIAENVRRDVETVLSVLFGGGFLSYKSPVRTRIAVQEHLRRRLYWKRTRVTAAFVAIRIALGEG